MDITLNTTGYSDAAQYDAFIKQSFRTQKSPGLFTWHTGDSLKQLVDEDLVAETTDLWTKAIDEGWATEGLRDEYTFDDKQYCVPMNIAYWVMYYNKNIFEEQGIEEPTTWEELDAGRDDAQGRRRHAVLPDEHPVHLPVVPAAGRRHRPRAVQGPLDR